jgi:2-polyprenyl-6-methoxyphenol hydroxylase-like FAD-dependent oxidoreductase
MGSLMRKADIAIVGGGLAGALAGAMLGRAGIGTLVVDPHIMCPPDFRCEKLDGSQTQLLRKTGLQDVVLPASTRDEEIWLARLGRIVDKKPHDQLGILYDTLVNAVRSAVKPPAEFLYARATSILATADRQTVTLSNGENISARLVVLATGLGTNLRRSIGIERFELSRSHSVSIGFDIVPLGKPAFDFRALTYFPERPGNLMAYLTLFPIGPNMRANYFTYRDIRDPWLQQLRAAPAGTLAAALPRLQRVIGDFEIPTPIDIRPVDLYAVAGHRRSGVVLVGDAFATSCPAAGTGVTKVFTDVERLCNVHIPRWLATPGMGADKITAFYDDPVKRAADEDSQARAFFLRSLSIDEGAIWKARRWLRFGAHFGRGLMRRFRPNAPAHTERLRHAIER